VDFFARQRHVRGTTIKLVCLFVLAVVAIIVLIDAVVLLILREAPQETLIGWLVTATALTVLLIGGGMIAKTLALRSGGSAVAASVGAVPVDPTTSDPVLRRYVNVVQEMSIASGVPMPRLFVMEQESGINAFAAGYTPADAAITVTGGALHLLNRDELQGVIGHEFSHIRNGDMRLNIRLIGLLSGILLLGLVGMRMMMFASWNGRDNRRGSNASMLLFVALAMVVLGFVGQFFASLIKAGISRQREWLADASSVQFTRQTTGLAGALKKIAGLPTGSRLRHAHDATQVSHMLFSEGGHSLAQLFATHPPLVERIKALDPGFDPDQVRHLADQWQAHQPDGLAEDAAAGLAAPGAARPAEGTNGGTNGGPARTRVAPDQVTARVGTVSDEDLAHGGELSSQLPQELRRLAGQPSTAVDLVLALLLHRDADLLAAQQQAITARLGPQRAAAATELAARIADLPPQLRLPLADLAAPALTGRGRTERHALLATLDELVLADRRVTLFEYCLTRLVAAQLRDAEDPARRSRVGRTGAAEASRDAALTVLSALAAAGNDDPAAAEHAFRAGAAVVVPGAAPPYRPSVAWPALDAAWPVLDRLAPEHKQRVVRAMVVAVRDDGALTLHEAELLRTACRLLHCPLPPFVA
jgi:Zn-dependent protease with chaperone function